AELDQAHVRMERLGDISLARVRAEHQAPHPAAVAELGAVFPLLDLRGRDVVPPAAPVVPGDEDRDLWLKSRRNQRLDLADGPLPAFPPAPPVAAPLRAGV